MTNTFDRLSQLRPILEGEIEVTARLLARQDDRRNNRTDTDALWPQYVDYAREIVAGLRGDSLRDYNAIGIAAKLSRATPAAPQPPITPSSVPIVVYTDGACSGNPGPGGWGVVLQDGRELSGGEDATTNNRMEMTGALRAIEAIPPGSPIEIRTDSMYVIDGMTKYLQGWIARDWKKADKKPVLNIDLWQLLSAAMEGRAITWTYVPSHSGEPGNERANELAQREAQARR